MSGDNNPLNAPLDYLDGWLNTRLNYQFKQDSTGANSSLINNNPECDISISDSITLGLKAYTPNNIGETEPRQNDHPYASYVFLKDSKTKELSSSTPNNREYWHTTFSIAHLDNNVARNYQNLVHQLEDKRDSRIPKGWHNKVSPKYSPIVFNYNVTRLSNTLSTIDFCCKKLDLNLSTFVGGNFGNVFIDAYGGISGRLGFFDDEYFYIPEQDQIKIVRQNVEYAIPSKKCGRVFECYFFGSLSYKAVLMNRLIEGYSGNNARCLDCNLERFVGLLSFGVTIKFTEHTTLSIAQHVRSNEFNSDLSDSNRSHHYGTLFIGIDNPIE